MIKGIMQSGKYVHVTGGYPTAPPIPYINYSGPQNGPQGFAGQVRYNVSAQGLEIFDGNVWVHWNPSYASVGLSCEAEELLDWAKEKRDKELLLETIAKDNIAAQDLIAQIKEKQHQLDMIVELVKPTDEELVKTGI